MAAARLSSPGLCPFLARDKKVLPPSSGPQAGALSIACSGVEIGAAWSKRAKEGRDYLSVKLDDPNFNTPIYANLFDDEGGETFSLMWSRGRKANDD